MRKLFAILMLAVYLFNFFGYTLLFHYYINKADNHIAKQADANLYSEKDLTEIKIKLNLPYITDWTSYERFDGQVELEGVQYNYVKRKVAGDTLYLLCLPNELKTQLYKTKTDYAVHANDLPAEKQNKNASAKKTYSLEGATLQPLQFSFSVHTQEINAGQFSSCPDIVNRYIPYAGEPPEGINC